MLINKKFIMVAAILVTLLSVSGVSAADNVTGDMVTLQDLSDETTSIKNDNQIACTGENAGTFDELSYLIENTPKGSTLALSKDYMYVNGSNMGIVIDKDIHIDGNGHVIDACGQSRIFYVTGDNVQIMNLKLINGFTKGDGGAVFTENRMKFENVTFTNNTAEKGGAVRIDLIESFNCEFEGNHAKNGGAILYSFNSYIVDSTFRNSHDMTNSVIYGNSEMAGIRIENCTFSNLTSKHAAALYSISSSVIINSTFTNIHSSESGGAIILKEMKTAIIENCKFINVTAVKDAGAIFIDSMGTVGTPGVTTISNTEIINSSANFAGGLLQLGGQMNIVNSTFQDNSAFFDGSAIYVSNAQASLTNISVLSNRLINGEGNGGGIYFDKSDINITNSIFIDNTKNAVYAYDCTLNISNTVFENNTEAIHGVFLSCNIRNITLNRDNLTLNDTDYLNAVSKNPIALTLINNTIDVKDLPARFDSREWGWISSVKDQIDDGSCWAFGTVAALESSLIKSTGIEYDFSENNIKNNMLIYSKYGIMDIIESGCSSFALQNILSWMGPVFEEDDTYDVRGKISQIFLNGKNIHVQDAIMVGAGKNPTDNKDIKKAIMRCGSLAVEYYATIEAPDYNNETHAQYQDLIDNSNHVVSVVGWDDNYPKENFLTTPPGNGAWILKDNFGLNNGDYGFIYLSYYDIGFLHQFPAIGFVFENNENYTRNYQTDLGGELNFIKGCYKTCYVSQENELISGIGTYFSNEGEDYALKVYVNDELKHTQSGKAPFYGFHTIRLTDEIPVLEGDNFTVEMYKETIPILNQSRQHYGNSTFTDTGNGWEILKDKTVSLKVYTKDLSEKVTTILSAEYDAESKNIVATLKDADGNHVSGIEVGFAIDGVKYVISDANGQAKYSTAGFADGTYAVKVMAYGNEAYKDSNKETVKFTIGNKEQSRIYLRNALFFVTQTKMVRVTLWDASSNPVAGKTVHIKAYNSTWTCVTNENGDALIRVGIGFGIHEAKVCFDGDEHYEASERAGYIRVIKETPSLMVRNADTQFKSGDDNKIIKVYLWNRESKPLPVNSKIALKLNGQTYIGFTDIKGIAHVKINVNHAGTFDAKVMYAGNSAYNALTRDIKITVK